MEKTEREPELPRKMGMDESGTGRAQGKRHTGFPTRAGVLVLDAFRRKA